MAEVTWDIRLFDNLSQPKVAAGMYPEDAVNNQIRFATNLEWTFPLNSVDMFQGAVYLDDPMAAIIEKKTCIIKVWRAVNDAVAGKTKSPVSTRPDFAGPVVSIGRNEGGNGMLRFTAANPMWRLQNHFHIRNHHLVLDNLTGLDTQGNHQGGNRDDLPLDQSALMFKLIDLISHGVLPSPYDSGLGIVKPLTSDYDEAIPGNFVGIDLGLNYWPKSIVVAPFYAGAGVSVWSEIMEDIMNREGGVDLVPEYVHDPDGSETGYGVVSHPVDGRRTLLIFNTALKRGTNRANSMRFAYRYGSSPNLETLDEVGQITPGTYANFVWVVGNGGPNTYFAQANLTAPALTDIDANGLYMKLVTVGGSFKASMDAQAPDELEKGLKADVPVYTANISPAARIYYDIDYKLGDVCTFDMEQGYWSRIGITQRIHQVILKYSDNNVESADIAVASDFTGKVAVTN